MQPGGRPHPPHCPRFPQPCLLTVPRTHEHTHIPAWASGYPEPEHPSLGLLQNIEGEGPRPGNWELSLGEPAVEEQVDSGPEAEDSRDINVCAGGRQVVPGGSTAPCDVCMHGTRGRPVMCITYGHPVVCLLPADIL